MTIRAPYGELTPAPSRDRRILLATDFSTASEAAAAQALDLVAADSGQLIVVSVIDDVAPPRAAHRASRPSLDQRRHLAEAAAQALIERARTRGVRATYLVWSGPPAQCIVEAATSEAVDLIVVGSHRRGTVGRLLFGSVAREVARRAPCPVVVAC